MTRCRIAIALLFIAATAGAQARVSGIAYDSLANAPLPGAYIAVPKLNRAATSDSLGRFVFDGVAPGSYTFVVQHDAIDAIGMSEIARQVNVSGDASIVVGIPSFGALWRDRCGGAPPADSALIFGTVSAPGGRPAANATVAVSWLDLVVETKKTVSQHQRVGRVSADPSGHYVLCGVPMSTGITIRASLDALQSGPLELLPLQKGVMRRDIQLNALNAAMVGTVTGTVTLEGREPTGTRVALEGLPEVRVNADGRFTIRNVPVGTHGIEATFVGMSPALAVVDVRPGAITTLELQLKKIVALPGMTITESAARMQLAREFDERRAQGYGEYRDSTQLTRFPSLESAFQDIPFVFVKGAAGRRSIYVGSCRTPAALIVDGVVTAQADFAWRDQRDIAAVEVYNKLVPIEFRAKAAGCGVIVVWTKNHFP